MVGPFMQGMLLMGIIYWYSKGLINMINDYYRGEFNRKLKLEQKLGQLQQQQTYDLSDMDQLVDIEMTKEHFNDEVGDGQQHIFAASEGNHFNFIATQHQNICDAFNAKKLFLNILFTISRNYYRTHPFKNPICWLNEVNSTTYNYTNTNYNSSFAQ